MPNIQARKRRGFLRQIAEGAKTASLTLREALLASQAAVKDNTFSKGRILSSTSGSGQTASFEIGSAGKEFTQENVFDMLEEFLEILEDGISQGTITDAADGIDATFAAMCGDDRLATIRHQHLDCSSFRR